MRAGGRITWREGDRRDIDEGGERETVGAAVDNERILVLHL